MVARQIPLANARLDVVAYDKNSDIFKVVECKPTASHVTVGKTFGQVSAYLSKIQAQPDEFVDAVSEKIGMRFRRWMEVTDGGHRIRVEMYVALPHETLRDVASLRMLKKQSPEVGLIRYKKDGTCKSFVRKHQKPNHELTRSEAKLIPLEGRWLNPSAHRDS
jgi:hypothetical protein